jgi:hypothetical protein
MPCRFSATFRPNESRVYPEVPTRKLSPCLLLLASFLLAVACEPAIGPSAIDDSDTYCVNVVTTATVPPYPAPYSWTGTVTHP